VKVGEFVSAHRIIELTESLPKDVVNECGPSDGDNSYLHHVEELRLRIANTSGKRRAVAVSHDSD
jgi:hypothetical protein